jgi:hypothetical protein
MDEKTKNGEINLNTILKARKMLRSEGRNTDRKERSRMNK